MNKKKPEAADEHISRRVQQRRREVGMSQERLGEHLGITFQQIQKYEKGSNRISAGRLMRIAKILEADTSYFYAGFAEEGEGEPKGFSEDDQPPLEQTSREEEHKRLLEYFDRLENPELREAVVDLIRALGVTGRPKS